MGCDIYNYKVLKIEHIVNGVNLDEIIVLKIDKIYLHGVQYDEDNINRDFLEEGHYDDVYTLIYYDDEFVSDIFDKKYRPMIEERITENFTYNYYKLPLDYNDDKVNFTNNYRLTDMENIETICITNIKRWRA